jgi:isocitrate/isopropylmalate dehydrogenase
LVQNQAEEPKPKITRFDGYILAENPGSPYSSSEDEEQIKKNRAALETEIAKMSRTEQTRNLAFGFGISSSNRRRNRKL